MRIANVALHSMEKDGVRLLQWLKKRCPDIVTLQKIGRDQDFPTPALCEIGYMSEFLGKRNRSDLGVAILSRRRMELLPGPKQAEESRCLTVAIGGLCVSSVYAPFGPTIESRVAWLDDLRDYVNSVGYAREDSLLCGDFNVMADGPPWKKGYSPKEWRVLDELLSIGFCDLYRCAHSDSNDMPGRTRGYDVCPEGTNRLHLILGNRGLKRRLRSACLDVESRPCWPREDAPPLVVDLNDANE